MAVGQASGKLILVGEHAVVHGEPALALPMSAVTATVSALPVDGPLRFESPFFAGELAQAPSALAGLHEAAIATFAELGAEASGFELSVASTIPLGAGLGSSAAVAVALVRALFAAHGREADAETLVRLATVAERHVHGNPSGVDASTVAFGAPIRFRRDQGARPLELACPLHLVVADTGRVGDTGAAVAAVASRLASASAVTRGQIARLGAIANELETALANGAMADVGPLLDAAQTELAAIGVSDDDLETLIAAARGAGATGAKLTGGGRGGCILASAPDAEAQARVATALTAAGARRVWMLVQPPAQGAAV